MSITDGTDRSVIDRERPVLVADGELAGLGVGAGLRIHDRALGCIARESVTRIAARHRASAGSAESAGEVRSLRSCIQCALQDGASYARATGRRVAETVCAARWREPSNSLDWLMAAAERGAPGRAAGRGFRPFPAPPARRRSAARWCGRSAPRAAAARRCRASRPCARQRRAPPARSLPRSRARRASRSSESSPSSAARLGGQQGGGLVVERRAAGRPR